MNICVVTILIGSLIYKKDSKKNHQDYCSKHSYTYFCLEESIGDIHPMWLKPVIIKEKLLEGFDYVFWMDGDSFFINQDQPLDKFAAGNHDLIFSGDENDAANTGHILFKNTTWSLEFLEKWLSFCRPLDAEIFALFRPITTHFIFQENIVLFNDQPPFNMLLAGADPFKEKEWFFYFNKINLYSGNPRAEKDSANFAPINRHNLERTQSLVCPGIRSHVSVRLQKELNSYPWTFEKGDFILHFVGDKQNYLEYLQSNLDMLQVQQ